MTKKPHKRGLLAAIDTAARQCIRIRVRQLISKHQMSERHACMLVGLSRDSYRNAPVASAQTEALKTKIVEIAHRRYVDPTR